VRNNASHTSVPYTTRFRSKKDLKELKQKNDSLLVVNETLSTEKTNIEEELISEKEKAKETESSVRSTFSISNYQLSGVMVKRSGDRKSTRLNSSHVKISYA